MQPDPIEANRPLGAHAPPPPGTVEHWCFSLLAARDAEGKLAPPEPPDTRAPQAWEPAPPARRIAHPARPPEWTLARRSARSPTARGLARPEIRARLCHTLLHHELQAAELFCWAVLAFPEAPREFRAGLVRLAREELLHLALYRGELERLGSRFGAFPVRDWFWTRVPSAATPAAFLAIQGLGLEGANLEHSARLAAWSRAAGDGELARVLERVGREEVAHVAFAVRWFERFTGAELDYDRWRSLLPRPLSPALLRGAALNRAARRRAGQDDAFLERLAAEPPTTLSRR